MSSRCSYKRSGGARGSGCWRRECANGRVERLGRAVRAGVQSAATEGPRARRVPGGLREHRHLRGAGAGGGNRIAR